MRPTRTQTLIGGAIFLLMLGIAGFVRIKNRPIVYFYKDQPLFQATSKAEGADRLAELVRGNYDFSLRISPNTTARLSFTDPLVITRPQRTNQDAFSLDPDLVTAIEEVVRLADPEKNTTGIIRLEDASLVSEPPAGDQVDRDALLREILIVVFEDPNHVIPLSFTSSEELLEHFDSTLETLATLLEDSIDVRRNEEPTNPITPNELAGLLWVDWPSEEPIRINPEAYNQSRFALVDLSAAFDFSDPTQLRPDTLTLPIPMPEVVPRLLAAINNDRLLNITAPASVIELDGLHLMSRFTTYHACCQDRVTNIQQMARMVDGVIVPTGASFSLNTFIGQRTEAKGFVPAGSILEGELIDSVGGGVSQFATTLYNAVFWAGLEDVRHQPHSWAFSRYPTGIEATISWPAPDLVFRNNTPHPTVIHTKTTDTSITVELWGNNDGRIWVGDHRAGVSNTKIVEEGGPGARIVEAYVTPPYEYLTEIPTFIYPNSDVQRFEPQVASAGSPGKIVNVFRTLRQGDQEHTDVWRVVYRPIPREIHVHPCDLAPEDRIHRFDKYDYSWIEC